MAIKFGRLDSSETTFTEQDFYKNQTVTSASEGVHHVFMKQDEYADPLEKIGLTESGSHWAFIHGMFYLSGSSKEIGRAHV